MCNKTNYMIKKLHFTPLLQAIFFALLASTQLQAQRPPNIVIIYTDDQGYGDLGCFGSTDVTTPHIDQMAAEGMKLTSFYQAAAMCTPSRTALMTGCYPARVGMAARVLLNASSRGLNPSEITMAEVLKDAGYATGMFGKWHLGDQIKHLPTRQGFDEFFGLPYSHDISPFNTAKNRNFPSLPMLEGETVVELDPVAETLTQRFTERAVQFIEKHKDSPFFLYVPHPMPHRPLHVTDPFLEGVNQNLLDRIAASEQDGSVNYTLRDLLYFQGVNEIDWSVGQILQALKDQGVDDDTLVIFTTDNGQARSGLGTAAPLRGSKGTVWEGGFRTPTVIRWPGHIASGTESDEILTAMDLLPTFANLAGGQIPTDRVIDGKDIWPVLTQGQPSPHEIFMYNQSGGWNAMRWGKWKLHTGGSSSNGGVNTLYDLDADIGETTNVRAANPDIVEQMLALRTAFLKEINANSRPADFVKNPVNLTLPPQTFVPDPNKVYHIENPSFGLRLAANGSSEDAYTTTLDVNNDDTRWVFVRNANGYYHIQRAAGGENPRLRTDNTSSPDMHTASKSGAYTYYSIDPSSNINGTYYLTLPDGPTEYQRLRILSTGGLDFSTTANVGSQPSLRIVEAKAPDRIVNIVKRTASFGLHSNDGSNGGALNLHSNLAHNNLKFNEIDRGGGFFSYERFNSAHSIDGGNGGAIRQNVYVWSTDADDYNQQWEKVSAGDGSYTLRKRNAILYGIHGGKAENLFNVNMHSNFSHPNLHWYVNPAE